MNDFLKEMQYDVRNTPAIRNELMDNLAQNMSQGEAAVLAVLCAHVRKNHEEWVDDEILEAQKRGDAVETWQKPNQDMRMFLQALENMAVRSINQNDGNVVHWLGQAAKQINPLLT